MQRLEREARNMADVAAGSSVATQQQAVAVDAMSRLVKGLSHTIERVETHAQATRRTTEESASHSAESERAVRAMADEMQGISEVVATPRGTFVSWTFCLAISVAYSGLSGRWPSRPTCWRSMLPSRRPEPANRGGVSPLLQMRCACWPGAPGTCCPVSDIVARIQNGTQDVVRSMGRAEQRVRDGVGLLTTQAPQSHRSGTVPSG